jgi:hypothetical protein
LLKNHEQRRARAGKLGLDRYPASHTRLVQRILSEQNIGSMVQRNA